MNSFTGEREGRCLAWEEGGLGGSGLCRLLGLGLMVSSAKAITSDGWRSFAVLSLVSPCCEGERDEEVEVLRDPSCSDLVPLQVLLSAVLLLHVDADRERKYEPDC